MHAPISSFHCAYTHARCCYLLSPVASFLSVALCACVPLSEPSNCIFCVSFFFFILCPREKRARSRFYGTISLTEPRVPKTAKRTRAHRTVWCATRQSPEQRFLRRFGPGLLIRTRVPDCRRRRRPYGVQRALSRFFPGRLATRTVAACVARVEPLSPGSIGPRVPDALRRFVSSGGAPGRHCASTI